MKNTRYFIKLAITVILLISVTYTVSLAAISGDVNKDGTVTSADARLALRAAVGLEVYEKTSEQFKAADVNGDGQLTSADARRILRAAVGLEVLDHTHTYGEWTKETGSSGAATGRHYRTCTVCDGVEYANCTYGEKVYTKQQTCTSGSEYYSECTVCGGRTVGGEAKLGHLKTSKVANASIAPTCTTTGIDVYYCSRCKTNVTYEIAATGHTPDISAATCTRDKICTKCNAVLEAKHHKDANNDSVCDVCKINIGKNELLNEFNTGVNILKNGLHMASGFVSNETKGKVISSSIKYSTGFKLLVSSYNATCKNAEDKMPTEQEMNELFKEEFNTSETENTLFSQTQRLINDSNFPISGSPSVSKLTLSDVSSIKKEKVNGIDFISSLPDSITVGSRSCSLARYKNASIGDVNKITVVLKTEKYSELKGKTSETALMHIGENDIRDMADDSAAISGDDTLGEFGTLDMECKEVVSDATVTYYFDATTNAPVAAKYTVSIIMTNSVDMNLEMFGESALSGNAEFTTTLNENSYYFFDNYFPEN